MADLAVLANNLDAMPVHARNTHHVQGASLLYPV